MLLLATLVRFVVFLVDLHRTKVHQVRMYVAKKTERIKAALRSAPLPGADSEPMSGEDPIAVAALDDDLTLEDIDVPRWGLKDSILFFVTFSRDLLHSLTYVLFFGVITYLYGLPIHMMFELYISVVALLNRISDLRRYMLVKSRCDLLLHPGRHQLFVISS